MWVLRRNILLVRVNVYEAPIRLPPVACNCADRGVVDVECRAAVEPIENQLQNRADYAADERPRRHAGF